MKKLLLFAFVLTATAFTASAQTEKGKWLVGASIGVWSQSDDIPGQTYKEKESSMSFQPSVSYFINDDMAIGLLLGIGGYKYSEDVALDKSSSMYVAPSFRYYLPISERFKFFGQLLIPIGTNKTTLFNGNSADFKTQVVGVNIMPAFAFFPSKKVSIEMGLGSLYFYTSKTGDVKTNTFGLNMLGSEIDRGEVDLGSPTIGFKLHLGK